ncbi:hypothetical protein AB4Z42_08535 [Mycobacterium sp. 2YAF39]|uniref:hypothetical protein n=1 Tax=Mycobacterium sp. 2YAF39 TaxID=3233033 RepID=UPI003F94A508
MSVPDVASAVGTPTTIHWEGELMGRAAGLAAAGAASARLNDATTMSARQTAARHSATIRMLRSFPFQGLTRRILAVEGVTDGKLR